MDIDTLYRIFQECTCVTTDSRNCPQGSLFIALKGENFNGNAFAARALEAGSSYAVVDEPHYVQQGDARYVLVDNCLQTLQQLARHHRRQLGVPVIGITGTNGKTTTKELMAAVLMRKYNLLYTQGNLNNSIGVPLTLLRLRSEHNLAVVEMGASHPGDIRELVEVAEPDFGLITNVGKAHLEGFGSFEGVIRTKGELFDFLRAQPRQATVFVHADNPYLEKLSHHLQQVTYGTADTCYVSGHVTGNSPYLSLSWTAEGETAHAIDTHLIGTYNFPNALAAVAVGRYFGVPATDIDAALCQYVPQNNRSQLEKTADNTLIIDAYNANPTSMMAALENFRLMEVPHKVAVLGDMKELGEGSLGEHRKIVSFLQECGFERVLLVGAEFGKTNVGFEHCPDVQAVKELFLQEKPIGKYILIKGSNSMKLSQLKDIL